MLGAPSRETALKGDGRTGSTAGETEAKNDIHVPWSRLVVQHTAGQENQYFSRVPSTNARE